MPTRALIRSALLVTALSATALDTASLQDGLTARPIPVPFPQSLYLLDVLAGTRHPEPPARRTDYPDSWNGAPAFDPESSAALLELVVDASTRELRLLHELRSLAYDRVNLGLPSGPRSKHQPPDGMVAEFRQRLQALEHLILSTRFRGYEPLTGTTPVVFLFQRPPSEAPQRFTTEDLSLWELGLTVLDIADVSDAHEALDLLDTAIVTMTFAHTRFSLARQDFEEGPPTGGLIAVEWVLERLRELALLATEASTSYYQGELLDLHFQSDLVRLDAIAAEAHYEVMPLLRGGLVLLEGAAGTVQLFELPDARASTLRVDTDVTDTENALGALQLLDAASAYVSARRAALERAREKLLGIPHVR